MQNKICQHLEIDVESAKDQLKGFTDTTDVNKLASERRKGGGYGIWAPSVPT
jgi:hypothetical protein